MHPTKLLITLIAIVLATFEASSGKPPQQNSTGGNMKGQVGATKSDGGLISAESATVYVLFSSPMEASSFSHVSNADTAGGQFSGQLNNLLAKNKELKNLQKSARQNSQPDTADQIAVVYLQSVDESLARVRSWLTKHPERTWQMKAVAPDEQGFWSVEGLLPGGYEVVVRGKVSGYEADWEGSVDLAPGGTVSLPLTRPRFVRNKRN